MNANPFATIESAHEYIALLRQQIDVVRLEIESDCGSGTNGERRLDALRLVNYKLGQLADHMAGCSRILNDLRSLRRLLLDERGVPQYQPGELTVP